MKITNDVYLQSCKFRGLKCISWVYSKMLQTLFASFSFAIVFMLDRYNDILKNLKFVYRSDRHWYFNQWKKKEEHFHIMNFLRITSAGRGGGVKVRRLFRLLNMDSLFYNIGETIYIFCKSIKLLAAINIQLNPCIIKKKHRIYQWRKQNQRQYLIRETDYNWPILLNTRHVCKHWSVQQLKQFEPVRYYLYLYPWRERERIIWQ